MRVTWHRGASSYESLPSLSSERETPGSSTQTCYDLWGINNLDGLRCWIQRSGFNLKTGLLSTRSGAAGRTHSHLNDHVPVFNVASVVFSAPEIIKVSSFFLHFDFRDSHDVTHSNQQPGRSKVGVTRSRTDDVTGVARHLHWCLGLGAASSWCIVPTVHTLIVGTNKSDTSPRKTMIQLLLHRPILIGGEGRMKTQSLVQGIHNNSSIALNWIWLKCHVSLNSVCT